ncbi:MAG: hypothetical protein A2297_03285 [Elusimicrobia bacterium RIFOXYB2_FULL_48_7]|nr:MAG: hypothetical protein A2297_03285 [Elusimicrobia bacterium RIFOXYB2_FULL_48_7]
MKKSYVLLLGFVFVFLSFAGMSAEDMNYKVVQKDTLWDLAGKYYNNPWQWKKIYNSNKDTIKNPDLILVDQEIVIPSAKAAEAEVLASETPQAEEIAREQAPAEAAPVEPATEEPAQEEVAPAPEAAAPEPSSEPAKTAVEEPPKEEAAEVAEAAEPVETTEPVDTASEEDPAPEVVEEPVIEEPVKEVPVEKPEPRKPRRNTSNLDPAGFVAPLDFEFDGIISGVKGEKTMIAQGDVVYLDIGSESGIKNGTMCQVLRKKGKVKGENGMVIGLQIRYVGQIEVTKQVNEYSSTAVVYRSYEPIVKGDLIKIIPEK